MTILGNTGTICAFIKERSLREKPSDLLILNLSVSDLGIGLFCMPFSISNLICDCWLTGEIGCRLWMTLSDVFVFSGVANLIVISLDRYLLVSLEYSSYLRLQTKRRIQRTIIACWTFPLFPSLLENSLWSYAKASPGAAHYDFSYQCLSPPRDLFLVTLLIIIIGAVIPMLLLSYFSLTFLFLLRKRLKNQRRIAAEFKSAPSFKDRSTIATSQEQMTSNDPQNEYSLSKSVAAAEEGTQVPKDRSSLTTQEETNSKDPRGDYSSSMSCATEGLQTATVYPPNRYTKPALTFIALISAMSVCTLPYCFYMLTSFFCSPCYDHTVRGRLITLVFFNSFLNPFMYAATQVKIRKFYRSQIRHVWRQI